MNTARAAAPVLPEPRFDQSKAAVVDEVLDLLARAVLADVRERDGRNPGGKQPSLAEVPR